MSEAQLDAYYFEPIRSKWERLRAEHRGSKFIKVFIEEAEKTMEEFKRAGYPVSNNMNRSVRTASIESRMLHLMVMMGRV